MLAAFFAHLERRHGQCYPPWFFDCGDRKDKDDDKEGKGTSNGAVGGNVSSSSTTSTLTPSEQPSTSTNVNSINRSFLTNSIRNRLRSTLSSNSTNRGGSSSSSSRISNDNDIFGDNINSTGRVNDDAVGVDEEDHFDVGLGLPIGLAPEGFEEIEILSVVASKLTVSVTHNVADRDVIMALTYLINNV